MTRRPKPSPPVRAGTNTAELPEEVVPIARPLDAALGQLTLRLDELAAALGVSRRTLERERSAGRFPPPDLHIGKMPLWRPETVRRWVEGGGR